MYQKRLPFTLPMLPRPRSRDSSPSPRLPVGLAVSIASVSTGLLSMFLPFSVLTWPSTLSAVATCCFNLGFTLGLPTTFAGFLEEFEAEFVDHCAIVIQYPWVCQEELSAGYNEASDSVV